MTFIRYLQKTSILYRRVRVARGRTKARRRKMRKVA